MYRKSFSKNYQKITIIVGYCDIRKMYIGLYILYSDIIQFFHGA